jgi:hypothetical protein
MVGELSADMVADLNRLSDAMLDVKQALNEYLTPFQFANYKHVNLETPAKKPFNDALDNYRTQLAAIQIKIEGSGDPD